MRNRLITIAGLLIFLLLCFVPNGEAQTCLPVNQPASAPWQVGLTCAFTSTSSPYPFSARGIVYWQVFFVPNGTVGSAAVSIDSSATGLTWVTGGVLTGPTIGPMSSAGSYMNTAATTPTNFAQLTPTVIGSGTVTVTIYGYINPPVGTGGGVASDVVVTSSLPAGSQTIGNVNIANVTAVISGAITSTQAVSVANGGASQILITVTGTWTGTLTPKASGDGTNYLATQAHPINSTGYGPWQTSITTNGTYAALAGGAQNFEVVGNTVATGSATVTIVASPGVGDVTASGINTPADAAANPTDAIHAQDFLQGWNGTSWDRLRTAGVGNGVASTGIAATAPYCEYISTLYTLTTGQYGVLNCDASGLLRTSSMMLGSVAGTPANSTDLVGGIYNSAQQAVANGQQSPLQLDTNGGLLTHFFPNPGSLVALSLSNQTSLTAAVVAKAASGNVYGFTVTNLSTSTSCFLQVLNSSSSPALGTNILMIMPVPASTSTVPGVAQLPVSGAVYQNFGTGISVGLATTATGSTACGTAGLLMLWYK
jgi:hypothetical protein